MTRRRVMWCMAMIFCGAELIARQPQQAMTFLAAAMVIEVLP